jgi:hypothetical protein
LFIAIASIAALCGPMASASTATATATATATGGTRVPPRVTPGAEAVEAGSSVRTVARLTAGTCGYGLATASPTPTDNLSIDLTGARPGATAAPWSPTSSISRRTAAKAETRLLGPAGDAAAAGLSRVDRFRALASDGVRVGDETYGINPHVINSVRKSGRRHVTPEDLIDALHQTPTPGTPGSRVFTNPNTGTRFFVNDSNQVVGVHPVGFR